MPTCVWSNGTACKAYIWKWGRTLYCNGRTPACEGKYQHLVETEYRLRNLGVPVFRELKP